LRIGSLDYDPLPIVRQYALDQKVNGIMEGDDLNQTNAKQHSDMARQIQNKLSNVVEKAQCVSTMRRIVRDSLEEKEKSRLFEVSTIFFGRDAEGYEKVKKFYRMSREIKLKELECFDQQLKKRKEELERDERQYEQRDKPRLKRNEVERDVILSAQIICTTLSMSASEKLEILEDIEYLIVDEACQCVELNNLIPFAHDPKKVILVGDQQQLPATTFSENSDQTCYSRSLFERFLQNEVRRFMLSIQYRMHPTIRQFPSDQFYEGMLTDAPSEHRQARLPFLVRELSHTISPLVLFDLKYGKEQSSETSKTNLDEAEFIESLLLATVHILMSSNYFPPSVRSREERLAYIR
jgi:hypothetical protein